MGRSLAVERKVPRHLLRVNRTDPVGDIESVRDLAKRLAKQADYVLDELGGVGTSSARSDDEP